MYQRIPLTQAIRNPWRRVNGRRERPSESSNSPSPPRPRSRAQSNGTKAIQQRKNKLACGKMTICSPPERSDSTQALAGIFSTGGILTNQVRGNREQITERSKTCLY